MLVAVSLSLGLHLAAALVDVARQVPSATPAQPAVRRFVKRLPISQRPLARRQTVQTVQRPLARPAAPRGAPAAAVAPAPLSTQRQGLQGIPIPLVEGIAPPPEVPLQPLHSLPAPRIGPRALPGTLAGGRAAGSDVDLTLELLGIDALDTGRHRAVVVVDPRDRRRLKGFLYLSGVYSDRLERAEQESPEPRRRSTLRPDGLRLRQVAERETLQGLADRLTRHTGVRAEVRDALNLDDPRLLEAPFLLLTVNGTFQFTPAEAANLGRYLAAGGFLYAETASVPRSLGNDYTFDEPALRALVAAALRAAGLQEGGDWRFRRLEADHPLFHCYYDVVSLPYGFWDWTYGGWRVERLSPPYLEGIEVQGRLAGVYSQKDYADFWAGEAERIREHDQASNLVNGRFMTGCEELPAYDLGVNILVYALTREGSLAHRMVAAE
ncbi:MAG: DUF4159 domain-containing protein [Candidatus Latescibacterota bacterium]